MKSKNAIRTQEMAENCEYVAGVMKSLAHPQRLMILCHLSEGKRTVSELEELCGASQSSVSQYLNRMKLEGLLISERRGLNVYYQIGNSKIMELIKVLH